LYQVLSPPRNQRRRKNHVTSLQVNGVTLVSKKEKVEAALRYYEAIIGSELPRSVVLDFRELGLPRLVLSGLGHPITKEGVEEAIRDLLLDKDPG
jgi:hypothetical protein